MSFDTKVNSYNINEISFNYIGIAIEFNLLITWSKMKTLFWQRKLAIAYANPCKVWLVHPELCQINDPHQPILPKFSQLCLNQGQAQLTFLEYPCMFFRTLLLHSMCTIVAHYEGSCCTSVVAQKYICNFPLKILDWSQTTSCKNRH